MFVPIILAKSLSNQHLTILALDTINAFPKHWQSNFRRGIDNYYVHSTLYLKMYHMILTDCWEKK